MLLDERKFKILQAIVDDYIATAEPIGSRTIAKKYGLGISAATIRNEMGDLTDMGLLSQPHTSAGRVPSTRGFRFYVDTMLIARPLADEKALALQRIFMENMGRTEYLMQEAAKALVRLTGYPAIVSEPGKNAAAIRHLQLVPLDEKAILLVLVTDTKSVKTGTVPVAAAPVADELYRLSQLMNSFLAGKTTRDITRDTIDKMLARFGTHAHVLMPCLGIIADIIGSEQRGRIFTAGVKNILASPEFSDIRKAEALLAALEDPDLLAQILGSADRPHGTIEITIGEENEQELLKNCSLVRAGYSVDGTTSGTIALIGPKRMDYVAAVSAINGVLSNIAQVARALGIEN
jgi:heat-inducible transcriptional repressor